LAIDEQITIAQPPSSDPMIETFLTTYDPSDLPGFSVDPLGFEVSYLFLADKILPGLTNVASRPRYFALICAGVHLCADIPAETPREMIRRRQETILRLERFWALANVLARPDGSGGVRGVTYAKSWADVLRRQGETRASAKYQLLSRQSQYGAVGMYGNVADGMQFLNREDFTLTPALGEVTAEAFRDETELPSSLRRAVLEDTDVSIATLTAWGERAHVDAKVKKAEAKCLAEALHSNTVRSCMAGLLKLHPWKDDNETELGRIARLAGILKKTGQHPDLREALACIVEFESCYQLVILALERLLWLCRHHAAAMVTLPELNGDAVLLTVTKRLPIRVRRLRDALDNGTEPAFRQDLHRLSDVRRFLEKVSAAAGDIENFIGEVVTRHTEVQRGKFDRGRRKMPWLERNGSRINLTMTRAGGMHREVTLPAQILPHAYRFRAADALISTSSNPLQS
jgi:hypothetical protein